MRMAIFLKQRPVCVPPEKVSVLEDFVSADSTGPGLSIVRREDVINAVSRLAPAGPNAGTGALDPDAFDRLLSDRVSAVGLSRQLGADFLLTVSISALQRANRRLEDPTTGVATDVEQWTLFTTYGVIDGSTGASLATGSVQSDYAKRNTKELKVEIDVIDPLLRDAADRIGSAVRATVDRDRSRLRVAAAADVGVRFRAVLADLSIPDVRTDQTGQYVVGASNYDLQPMNVQVEVDGAVVGQCPGTFAMAAGVHRVRFSRPGLEAVEMIVNAKEGLEISVPLQLSQAGRANWQRDAAFFNQLKNGATLRDVDLTKVRAIADFLRQSDIRIDTSKVQNLNLGGESLWMQLLK
jgi:hypothetical protein